MKWEEFQGQTVESSQYEITNIECPICGEKIYKNTQIVLTSYPARYQYKCLNCNWIGCK